MICCDSSFFVILLLFSLCLIVITKSHDSGEYDRMHPQRHLVEKYEYGRRSKREMPPVQFKPPIREQNIDYWNNIGQDILYKQLKKNQLNKKLAKNVIFFLGDGMSIPTITAARVYIGGEEQKLSFEKFPYVGLSKTYCANTQVADSACSATAYLGGVKANYATIGLSAASQLNDCNGESNVTNHVPSIVHWAQLGGMATGFITTTTVTHASPAGIYSHTVNRNWENDDILKKDGGDSEKCTDIARQLVFNSVGQNLKVIMGGGRKHFLPRYENNNKNNHNNNNNILTSSSSLDLNDEFESNSTNQGSRADNLNLIEQWIRNHVEDKNKNNTVAYIQTRDELLNLSRNTEYLMGLFNDDHLPFHLDSEMKQLNSPTLSEMVSKALDILESQNDRYFLFVEGGRIDHAHHDTEAIKAIDETIEFDKAIELARKRTSEDDTLIVVTSDHSHTMSVAGYSSRKNDIFGINNGQIATDELPYATISYANGPGFSENMKTMEGKRRNLREVNMHDKDFKFPTAVPLDSETHGGDDVPVFASGPWAHLFTGNYEQSYIPHAIAYAACIGNKLTACSNKIY